MGCFADSAFIKAHYGWLTSEIVKTIITKEHHWSKLGTTSLNESMYSNFMPTSFLLLSPTPGFVTVISANKPLENNKNKNHNLNSFTYRNKISV